MSKSMNKKALISVWDKTNILEFSKLLIKRNFDDIFNLLPIEENFIDKIYKEKNKTITDNALDKLLKKVV